MTRIDEFFIKNESDMLAWGAELAKKCGEQACIYLKGQLGAGKTTLVRGFLQGLGYSGLVKSPTYTIVESYSFERKPSVFHFDLYRLNHPKELLDIGLDDYLSEKGIYLFEWPEKAGSLLPKATLICTLTIPDDGCGRKIKTQWCDV